MEYVFLKYVEGPFIIDKEFKFNNDNSQNLDFQMIPEFKYRKNNDVVGCQITFTFHKDGKRLLLFGFVQSVAIKGFRETIKTVDNEEAFKSYLKPLWAEILKFTRGVLATKLNDTVFSNFMLPEIDLEKFRFAITEDSDNK